MGYKGIMYSVKLAIHSRRHNPSPTHWPEEDHSRHQHRGIGLALDLPEYNGAKAAAIISVRGVGPILRIKEVVHLARFVREPWTRQPSSKR